MSRHYRLGSSSSSTSCPLFAPEADARLSAGLRARRHQQTDGSLQPGNPIARLRGSTYSIPWSCY